MKPLSSYQKLFIISTLYAVFLKSSATPCALSGNLSCGNSSEPLTTLDDLENNPPVYDNNTSSTRDKRCNELGNAQWGTNWCLDQITDPENSRGNGKYFQTDTCCKKLVQCTNDEKEVLLRNYPLKRYEIRDEIFRSCICDEEFDDCLHEVKLIRCKAQMVGKYYFRRLARRCRDDHLEKVRNLRFSMDVLPSPACLFKNS